jgi:hypothetical protein
MTSLKFPLMTLPLWARELLSIGTFLQYLGCWAAFVIISVAIVGPMLGRIKKIIDQQNSVSEQLMRLSDKHEKMDLIVSTFP